MIPARHRVSRSTSRLGAAAAACWFLFLAGPARGAEGPPVSDLLQRTGAGVATFLENFSDVKCTELVSQAKLKRNGSVEYKEDSAFDLLVTENVTGGDLALEESRLAERQPVRTKNLPLLVTNGFSTLLLVFHPLYQGSFQFARTDDEVMDGKRYLRVHFQHIRGTRTPAALLLRGREYPLELAGTAWLDPESGMIVKIRAGLQTPMDDLGLRSFGSEVSYAPVAFAGARYWLPVTATVDVETPRQHWRNVHRFTDYKRFSVSTEASVANP